MDIKIKIGVVVADDNNNILLIKEKIPKNKLPLWNIIKGTYDDNGEESIIDAAKRECLEEASISVELINALGCYISKEQTKIRIQFNFLAKIISGKAMVPKIDEQFKRDESILEIKWFAKNEILKMQADKFISNRVYNLVMDWANGKQYPLEIYKQILM